MNLKTIQLIKTATTNTLISIMLVLVTKKYLKLKKKYKANIKNLKNIEKKVNFSKKIIQLLILPKKIV